MKIVNNAFLASKLICILHIWGFWILLAENVWARPEDIFEKMAGAAVQAAVEATSILSNGAAIFQDHSMEVPFAKVHSNAAAGIGEAIVERSESDSESSEEDRRKRSISNDFNLFKGEDFLLPLPHYHDRAKRSPCWGTMGGGGTGGGTGGADDVDVVEARRRAARRRLAAQRKRSKASTKKSSRKKTSKKRLVGDYDANDKRRKRDIDYNVIQQAKQITERVRENWNKFANSMGEDALRQSEEDQQKRRRKRQTEVDDLNTTGNTQNSFAEKAQQIAQQIQQAWQNAAKALNDMAQQIKQKFNGTIQGTNTGGNV